MIHAKLKGATLLLPPTYLIAQNLNQSTHPQSYETQYTQIENDASIPTESIKFTDEQISDAINNATDDPKEALDYIVYYMFTQINTNTTKNNASMF